jgi:hypothetical protein
MSPSVLFPLYPYLTFAHFPLGYAFPITRGKRDKRPFRAVCLHQKPRSCDIRQAPQVLPEGFNAGLPVVLPRSTLAPTIRPRLLMPRVGLPIGARGIDDGEHADQKISVDPWADMGRGWCRARLGPRRHSDGQGERHESSSGGDRCPDTA